MDFKIVICSFIHKTYIYSKSADYLEQVYGQTLLEELIGLLRERKVSPNL